MKRLFAFALLLVAILPAWAQEKETPDPRLAQKVTLEASDITLTELMQKLSEQTKVNLSVDPRPAQWSVRERKVSVVLQEVPLGEVQTALEKLFIYSWKKAGNAGAWDYVLYQSEVDRAREARLRSDKQEAQARQQRQATQRAFDHYMQAMTLSPAQAEKIKESDPWGYLMATWPAAKAVGNMIGSLPQGTLDQVSSGGKYRISYRDMSPEMRRQVGVFAQGVNELIQRFEHSGNAPQIKEEDLKDMTMVVGPAPDEAGPLSGDILAMVQFAGIPNTHIELPLMNPDSEIGKRIGNMIVAMTEGQNPREAAGMVDAQMGQTQARRIAANTPQIYTNEKPPKDPVLQKEVSIALSASNLFEAMKKLSPEIKFSMIADSYAVAGDNPPYHMNLPAPETRIPLYQLLNNVGGPFGRTWIREKSLIVWQDSEWPIKRTWDVPAEWIAYFKTNMVDGAFGLDKMQQMAAFSEGQIRQTIMRVPALGAIARQVLSQRGALLFYGSLSGSQRNRLQNGQQIPVSSLTPSQWKLAADTLETANTPSSIQAILDGGSLRYDSGKEPGQTGRLLFTDADGKEYTCRIGPVNAVRAPQPAPNK